MIAVYPGSFDPFTSGHLDILTRAAALYDEVVILVAVNAAKAPAFTLSQRVEMIEASVEASCLKNVRVESFSVGLLVDYVARLGAKVIVKGLRAVSDFEYELAMASLNRNLKPEIETVFLMTATEYSYLSSSMVKDIARLGGNITGLVPDAVFNTVRDKYAAGVNSAGAQLIENP